MGAPAHPDVQAGVSRQDALYGEMAPAYGAAIRRLARAYEEDRARREELVQEIHLALWQSLARFDDRCSLRTWVYRVAHNVASAHVLRSRRSRAVLLPLEEIEDIPDAVQFEAAADARRTLDRIFELAKRLKPLDRQMLVLYLEGLEAAEIAEIVGLQPGNVATRIHRLKQALKHGFGRGDPHGR